MFEVRARIPPKQMLRSELREGPHVSARKLLGFWFFVTSYYGSFLVETNGFRIFCFFGIYSKFYVHIVSPELVHIWFNYTRRINGIRPKPSLQNYEKMQFIRTIFVEGTRF